MSKLVALLLSIAVAGPAATAEPADVAHRAPAPDAIIRRIAVGSCLRQERPAPILRAVAAIRPDLVLLLGDNVYADTDDPVRMRAAYASLAAIPEYRDLVAAAPVLATWDDHDFGADDAGADWPFKRGAKEILLEFFDEPATSPRRSRDGVYDARVFGPPGQRLQVILLDTRWFRSPLLGEKQHYRPNPDPAATLLGDAQWAWLTEQLRKPAEVRVLASSIQVIADEHGFEKWANFPAERARLLRAIGDAGAAGLVVVSGDRHRGELSLLAESPVGYPLFDLTASSLNLPIVREEANRHRLGPLVTAANFGLVEIDWSPPAPSLTLRLVDEAGATVLEQRVPLERLASRRRPG